MRLVLFGLSGAGKTTSAGFVEELCRRNGHSVARLSLAEPLYRLQTIMYEAAGCPISPGDQDQLLLETLAAHLRRINPEALAADFLHRLRASAADVVINADLRDPHIDALALRAQGFRFIRLVCDTPTRRARLAARGDIAVHPDEPSARDIDRIEPDVIIDNNGSLTGLFEQVHALVGGQL